MKETEQVVHKKHAPKRHRKNFTAVNSILLLLTGLSVAACGFFGYRMLNFSSADYDAQIAAIAAETEQVNADTAALQEKLAAEDAELRANLVRTGEEGAAAAERLSRAQSENETLTAERDELQERVDFIADIANNVIAYRDEYAATIRKLEDMIVAGESDAKICYWTFDDGPAYNTPLVLDIAQELGAYVTFFTSKEANASAANDDPAVERSVLRREVMEGHSVQNHTVSHQYAQYGNVYGMGLESFVEQVRLQEEWITECTGFKPDIFRFPGGSAWAFNRINRESMLNALAEMGYEWVDWHCDVMDNLVANPDSGTVYSRAMYQIPTISPNIAIVLSHDWNGNTVYAFKRAVNDLQKKGYLFLPLFSQSWTMQNTTIKYS